MYFMVNYTIKIKLKKSDPYQVLKLYLELTPNVVFDAKNRNLLDKVLHD